MNTRFKLALIRHLSDQNKGFALVAAVAVGVGLILLGMTMMLRTSSDQAEVLAQDAKTKAVSAAEIGVTKLEALLDENRIITMYSSNCASGDYDCWARINQTTNPPKFQDKLASKASVFCPSGAPETQAQKAARLNQIVRLAQSDPNDLSTWESLGNKSYYRLISYVYNPAPGKGMGEYPGTGILTIEGLSGEGSTQARTRLQVEIPVKDVEKPTVLNRNTAPGLWIKQGATEKSTQTIASDGTYSGGFTFQGDVLMSDCSVNPKVKDHLNNFPKVIDANGTDYQADILNIPFPEQLPNRPNLSNSSPQKINILNYGRTFPNLATDTPTYKTIKGQSVPVYEYVIGKIDLKGKPDTITITPGYKVVFYVDGSVDGSGTGGIVHDCTGVTDCKPTDFQIYAGYDVPSNQVPSICLNGDKKMEGFILAPKHQAGMTGGGGAGGFRGSLWVKDWAKDNNCTSNNDYLAVIQTAEWDQLPIPQPEITLLPKMAPISAWQEKTLD